MKKKPKIAICGFNLESNRFAPTCAESDFRENMFFVGREISDEARKDSPAIHLGVKGFYNEMNKLFGHDDDWIDVPTMVIGSCPAGPVEEEFFNEFLERLRLKLLAAGPLDGVYICQHGAAVATHTHDPDGIMFDLIRKVVGDETPIVTTLDLHANISELMTSAVDVLVGYRTNPHVDMFDGGVEAASVLKEMLDGMQPEKYTIRLPLVAPSVTQLTAEGFPYGDLIRYGQKFLDEDIFNVTILSGFAFGDTPKNGMTIIVHSRSTIENARVVAEKLAVSAWTDRTRYVPKMTSLEQAVGLAQQAQQSAEETPFLFADPADNPGGGGRGNTTYILEAFIAAGIKNCVFSVFYDVAAVELACKSGVNSEIEITLNSQETNEYSKQLKVKARVVSLHSGKFRGHYGMVAGTTADTGKTAVLDLGGITIICISKRQQCRSSDFISAFGLDASSFSSIVVKSRGHFRAGFSHLFSDDQIIEVDVPGLTSPNLSNFKWSYLPRPVYPLDNDTLWDLD